jgi:hypothetical protein
MTTLKAQVSKAIDRHCEAHAAYRRARFELSMLEMQGQLPPEKVASYEADLVMCYRLLHEAAEEWAAISAALEFGTDEGEITNVQEN